MDKIRIIRDAGDTEIAQWLASRLADALARRSDIAITVPGGSTPFPILAELLRTAIEWPRIAVWPGDDRIVAEDHPASNVGRIRALLEPAGAQIVSLTPQSRPPHFALAWLGMGTDGHVASLFPSTDPRADDPARLRRLTPSPLPPEAPFDRLSLTIPALTDSDEILFVVRGAEKAALFQQAAQGGNDLPVARLLAAAKGPVTCFV